MRWLFQAPLLAAALVAVSPGASAGDDQERIPLAVLDDEPAPAGPALGGSVFIETNGEAVLRRTLLVPMTSTDRRREVLRLLADGRGDWSLAQGLSARLSARAGVTGTHDNGHHQDEQIDLREAALQWRRDVQDGPQDVLELGRVNLRQGVALGFNPTDYFKPRTTVDTSTRDPQVQRVNRLGVVMLDAQRVGATSSLLVALAPKLMQPASLVVREPQSHLRLGDTNGENRLLIKGQLPLTASLRPELLAFKDPHGWRVGANLTQAFGQQVTGFFEYAGGRRKPLLRRTLEDGVALGDLPASALAALPDEPVSWLNDVAIGGTWTGSNRLSLTAEFDLQQGGLTRDDWQRWFALGSSSAEGAALAWYLRGAAAAQLDPLFRRNLFLRAQWDQAGHRDISLNAFINRNLGDRSQLLQFGLEYRLSQASQLRAMALHTRGRDDSHYGSDPADCALLLGYVHYL